MSSSLHVPCTHQSLVLEPSAYATTAGYYPLSPRKLAAALSTAKALQGKKANDVHGAGTFPAPLVLPNDELALDPECPGQNMKEWLAERKQISGKRKVIYVAAPPAVNEDASFITDWATLCSRGRNNNSTPSPATSDITAYLEAFYHGASVRPLHIPLSFGLWDTKPKAPPPKGSRSRPTSPKPTYIALCTDHDATRIRTRPDPTRTFPRQLCLDDLLDCAITILPADAYALLLLVQQDLFEDADDDFVCGRAYGGSRVAVVSMARYQPALDAQQGVERVHAWPACHCQAYVEACCGREEMLAEKRSAKKRKVEKSVGPWQEVSPGTAQPPAVADCPLQLAVRAHAALPLLDASNPSARASPEALSALWLTRVCRTASHELGHCFGIEHCVYYACVMQGAASIGEDARQPPYLCPVDLAKILVACSARAKERYETLLGFCRKHAGAHMFDAFAAWIEARLRELD